MRKPARGVCSTCGAPTVAPTPAEFTAATSSSYAVSHGRVEVSGHLFEQYERGWVLKRVGCREHSERAKAEQSWGPTGAWWA